MRSDCRHFSLSDILSLGILSVGLDSGLESNYIMLGRGSQGSIKTNIF